MICKQLTSILGFKCYPLSEAGDVVLIDSPLQFKDGDPLPIYLEVIGDQYRFFDDGETIAHFLNRGASSSAMLIRSIRNIIEKNGLFLSDDGVVQVLVNKNSTDIAFSHYISAMISISKWEEDNIGRAIDLFLLAEEVQMCFKAAYPNVEQRESGEYFGISGHAYKFDFIQGEDGVLSVTTHPNSISTALKKILDINNNNDISTLVVIDDRNDRIEANNQSKLLSAAASKVMLMTDLENLASSSRTMN